MTRPIVCGTKKADWTTPFFGQLCIELAIPLQLLPLQKNTITLLSRLFALVLECQLTENASTNLTEPAMRTEVSRSAVHITHAALHQPQSIRSEHFSDSFRSVAIIFRVCDGSDVIARAVG